MPRYYFHLRRGSHMTVDAEGQDFPDDDAARAEAAEAVHEILRRKSAANTPTYRRRWWSKTRMRAK